VRPVAVPGRTRERWARLLLGLVGLLAAATLAAATPPAAPADAPPPAAVTTGRWVHALAAYAAPKYPPGFDHFDYVDPDAPKGGVLRLRNPDRRSSFDKFNPFTVKGVAPAGVPIFMLESLATGSMDEPQAIYGLLAESIYVAPDLSSVSYRLRPEARFSNGDPVTPEDVVHSFRLLTSKLASPTYQVAFADIAQVVAVDARTVRFDLKSHTVDTVFLTADLPVLSHRWGNGKALDQIVLEPPIATGPYLIDRYEIPRRIEFRRNPDYWARDLPVRRGMFNFDRVVYRFYQDSTIAREAFKAGEFDILKEYSARAWVRQHRGAKWRDGRIVKNPFPVATGQGLQSIILNLRRPKFQDIRVREALILAWDFETYNKYHTFKRANSLFNNSNFAAAGEPSPAELALLEPFRAELPPRVFGPAYRAPRTDTDPNALRANLRRARDLLAAAGWKVAADGKLRNAAGEAFEFEYLEPSQIGRNAEWQHNLEKLGITLTERLVDFALFRRRLENYDFDAITIAGGQFTLPSAKDLEATLGSASADEPGGNNFRGVKSRAVDRLIAVLGQARTMDELRTAARALDRVVMWNQWQVPQLYLAAEQASYWNRFGLPKVQAKYFEIDTASSEPPWPLMTWWDKSVDKRN
jgi:microcin C transport system substrate-binding protein